MCVEFLLLVFVDRPLVVPASPHLVIVCSSFVCFLAAFSFRKVVNRTMIRLSLSTTSSEWTATENLGTLTIKVRDNNSTSFRQYSLPLLDFGGCIVDVPRFPCALIADLGEVACVG